MNLVIRTGGSAIAVYDESLDLQRLGPSSIRRASHVEPDDRGQWWADLAPVFGPRLGPFAKRSQALAAEAAWLDARLLSGERSTTTGTTDGRVLREV